jgi:hypothetical protein
MIRRSLRVRLREVLSLDRVAPHDRSGDEAGFNPPAENLVII